MGYTPAFDTIYEGTLYGKWPAAAVWATLIPLMDSRGLINRSFEAISGMTGWPMDLLKQGIAELEQPDPFSRTPAEEGRRLVRLDPSRPWGWRVVNHAFYREKARLAAKRLREVETGENAARMSDRRRPPETAGDRPECDETAPDRLSYSYSYSDSYSDAGERARKRACRLPDDFEPDLAYASTAVPDIDAQAEYARFRDYWRAKAGSAGTKLDWQATWRNWVRNCKDSGRYTKRSSNSERKLKDAFETHGGAPRGVR